MRIIGYSGFVGEVGGENGTTSARGSSGSSRTARSWSSSAATNNNSWGVGISEEGLPVRLDRQRLPERLHADRRTAITSRSAACRHRGAREHRRLEPLLPDHRERPAGRLARRVHRRRRLGALHGANLSQAVLEQDRIRGRADRAPPGDVHAHPRRHRFPLAQRLEPRWRATTSGPRRSWRRSAPTATSG